MGFGTGESVLFIEVSSFQGSSLEVFDCPQVRVPMYILYLYHLYHVPQEEQMSHFLFFHHRDHKLLLTWYHHDLFVQRFHNNQTERERGGEKRGEGGEWRESCRRGRELEKGGECVGEKKEG